MLIKPTGRGWKVLLVVSQRTEQSRPTYKKWKKKSNSIQRHEREAIVCSTVWRFMNFEIVSFENLHLSEATHLMSQWPCCWTKMKKLFLLYRPFKWGALNSSNPNARVLFIYRLLTWFVSIVGLFQLIDSQSLRRAHARQHYSHSVAEMNTCFVVINSTKNKHTNKLFKFKQSSTAQCYRSQEINWYTTIYCICSSSSWINGQKTTVKYWHYTPLFRGWCMRRPSWSWLKCLKTILLTECSSYNYQLEFCRNALDLRRNFSKCAFSEIKTRARSRPRTPFWRSLVLGWRQALRHSPQGVSRNIRSTNVGHLSEPHLTDQNQCSYPNYILPC